MNMFEPKNEKPYWEMIYNHVKDLPVGTIVTNETLSKVIEIDIKTARGAVYKARKVLLEQENKFLEVMRGVGYQVVAGMDIMKHAKHRQKSARRQIRKADFETANINTVGLSPEEQRKLDDFIDHNAIIAQAFRSNAKALEVGIRETRKQLTGVEANLAGAQIAQFFTEEQLKKLKDMIGE